MLYCFVLIDTDDLMRHIFRLIPTKESCSTRWLPPTKTRVQSRTFASKCPFSTSSISSCSHSSLLTYSWPWLSSHSRSKARRNCKTARSTKIRYHSRIHTSLPPPNRPASQPLTYITEAQPKDVARMGKSLVCPHPTIICGFCTLY